MARYSSHKIVGYLEIGNNGESNATKGKAFEDLICYVFEQIPGIEITQRNELNEFRTEEIDVDIWNDRKPKGLYFLPHIVLIECKNWANPVSSIEVNWFASKLQSRGCNFGILVANNGITGNATELTQAHHIVSSHLERGRQIIVITGAELASLNTTEELIKLVKQKLCLLTVSGTIS